MTIDETQQTKAVCDYIVMFHNELFDGHPELHGVTAGESRAVSVDGSVRGPMMRRRP